MSDINGFKDPAPSPNPTAKRGGFAPARGKEAKKDRPPAALPKRHRGNAVLPKPGRRAQNGGEVTRSPHGTAGKRKPRRDITDAAQSPEESKYLRQSRRLVNVNRSKRVKMCAT